MIYILRLQNKEYSIIGWWDFPVAFCTAQSVRDRSLTPTRQQANEQGCSIVDDTKNRVQLLVRALKRSGLTSDVTTETIYTSRFPNRVIRHCPKTHHVLKCAPALQFDAHFYALFGHIQHSQNPHSSGSTQAILARSATASVRNFPSTIFSTRRIQELKRIMIIAHSYTSVQYSFSFDRV